MVPMLSPTNLKNGFLTRPNANGAMTLIDGQVKPDPDGSFKVITFDAFDALCDEFIIDEGLIFLLDVLIEFGDTSELFVVRCILPVQ